MSKDCSGKSTQIENKVSTTSSTQKSFESMNTTTPKVTKPHYIKTILLKDVKGRQRTYHVPAALDLDRPKRPRTTFSPGQIHVLEMLFTQNPFLSKETRQTLSVTLGLSETQIKVWFQNRRTKVRRQDLQQQEIQKETWMGMSNLSFLSKVAHI